MSTVESILFILLLYVYIFLVFFFSVLSPKVKFSLSNGTGDLNKSNEDDEEENDDDDEEIAEMQTVKEQPKVLFWSILYMLNASVYLKIALYLSQIEIHTVAARAAPGDLGLKSRTKD